MTAILQRAELQRRIWQIANDVRGSIDGWDFKQYVRHYLIALSAEFCELYQKGVTIASITPPSPMTVLF